MSIALDVAERKHKSESSKVCRLGHVLTVLNKDDKDALEYAIGAARVDATRPQKDRIFTVTWLTKLLNDNKRPVGKTVVSEHLRKVCACEQPSE